jgi:hypothetical protein
MGARQVAAPAGVVQPRALDTGVNPAGAGVGEPRGAFVFLQERDNLAIAFVILLFEVIVVFLYVEIGIVLFLGAGAGLFIHSMYYALGSQGTQTGGRVIVFALFAALTARALYEYVRQQRQKQP